MAVKAGKTPSVFPDRETAERLVRDTWATGRPIRGTTKKVKDYSPLVIGHTHDGQEENKVIVSYKPGKNFIHGWPAGKKSQPAGA